MEPNNPNESHEARNMYSVVERINAGYEKFFDAKPKTKSIGSQCFSNYKPCGTSQSKYSMNGIADRETAMNDSKNNIQQAASNNDRNVEREVQYNFHRLETSGSLS